MVVFFFFFFSDPQYIQNMWLAAVDPLIEIIKYETEPEIVCSLVEALTEASSLPLFMFCFSSDGSGLTNCSL